MQDTEFFHELAQRVRNMGYKVEEKTEYHFRVNDRLDVYPVGRRWHDIKINERGSYRDMLAFISKFFRSDSRHCVDCGRPTGITSNVPPTVTCKECF